MPVETPLNGWNEYKRLVLAELERLNQAVEKLREQSIESDRQLQRELLELRDQITSTLSTVIDKGDADIKAEVKIIEKNLHEFKAKFHQDDKASSSWGFWAAVVSMVTALIVSIISLVVTLYKP